MGKRADARRTLEKPSSLGAPHEIRVTVA